jgi:hypothetical protein
MVRDKIRFKHYRVKTEKSYVDGFNIIHFYLKMLNLQKSWKLKQ